MSFVPWVNAQTIHGLIARYYANIKDSISLVNGVGALVVREKRDDLLVEKHSPQTLRWIQERLSVKPKHLLRVYCTPEELSFFQSKQCERYKIFKWNRSFPLLPKNLKLELRELTHKDLTETQILLRDVKLSTLHPENIDLSKFITNRAFGAFMAGKLVALRGVFDQTESEIEIGRAFTHEDFRSQGIQSALLENQLQVLAPLEKEREIIAFVERDNLAPQKVLAKFGFQTVGEICLVDLRYVTA